VTRAGYLGNLGGEPKVVGGIFATPQGVWSKPLVGTSVAVIAMIVEHTRPTEADYQQQAGQIRESIMNERRQTLFTEWMQALRKKAKIEDFRENYFEA